MSETELERIARLETSHEQMQKDICEIFRKLDEIKNKLLQRPSWAVTFMLTGLITLCVSLIILVLK